jgi:hypothetical protein
MANDLGRKAMTLEVQFDHAPIIALSVRPLTCQSPGINEQCELPDYCRPEGLKL